MQLRKISVLERLANSSQFVEGSVEDIFVDFGLLWFSCWCWKIPLGFCTRGAVPLFLFCAFTESMTISRGWWGVCHSRSPRMTRRLLSCAAQKKWFAMSTMSCTPAATRCLCSISEPAFWVRPSHTQCVGCNRCSKQRFCIKLRKRCKKKLGDEAVHRWILQHSGLRAPGPWRRWYHLSLREADLWLLASCLRLTETAGHFSGSFHEMTTET